MPYPLLNGPKKRSENDGRVLNEQFLPITAIGTLTIKHEIRPHQKLAEK